MSLLKLLMDMDGTGNHAQNASVFLVENIPLKKTTEIKNHQPDLTLL